MSRTVIQVPVTSDLRVKAEKEARLQGFSSVQEMVRVFLTQVASKEVDVKFTEKPVVLSSKKAAEYDKMVEDVRTGRVKTKTFKDVESLMEHLHSGG